MRGAKGRVSPVLRAWTLLLWATVAAIYLSQSSALAQPKPRVPRFPIVGSPDRAPVDLKRDWDMLKGRGTPEQTTNLTNSPADELGPVWSGDDRFIYFYSNRVSATNGARGTNYHIYTMSPDGTGIRQITTEAGDQIEPALSVNQNRLAYVARASATAPYHLFVRNLVTGAVLSLTRERTDLPFTEVRQPTWSPSGLEVAFAGKVGSVYHIFVINVDTGVIRQVTAGNCNDMEPAWSPDGSLIAFTSDRTDAAGTSAKPSTDIWTVTAYSLDPGSAVVRRVTNFSAGGVQSSNKQATWSLRELPRFITGATRPILWLAFASNRQDTNSDGTADAVGSTFDIYFMDATVLPDGSGLQTVEPTAQIYHIDARDPAYSFDEEMPTWSQFTTAIKLAHVSNRTGNWDIFSTSVVDLTAPSLEKVDVNTNEIVQVTPRVSLPGTTVRIRAKVRDLESGVAAVYAQIKDPDSRYQDALGVEHKVYFNAGPITAEGSSLILTLLPYEFECQPIDPATNTYVTLSGTMPGRPTLLATRFAYPPQMYEPGVDDFSAFSGAARPPKSHWLRLWDDGPASQGGHEPDGEVAGDGIYTNTWATPANNPSDWYLDIIAYDRAVNPFRPTQQSNWKIYDNVWGFSTKPFSGSSKVLFVSDYTLGQKFFQGRFAINFALDNVFFTYWGTESWLTDIDLNYLPWTGSYLSSSTDTEPKPVQDTWNTLGVGSYGTRQPTGARWPNLAFWSSDSLVTDSQNYDIWRILCRGPVPQSVYLAYLPRREQQPSPSNPRGATQTVLVADRCIVWAAPYAGNVWAGSGTITDLNTQRDLTQFVAQGGRLFVFGQDIGWALTLDGTQANAFFSTVLRAQYVNDQHPSLDPLNRNSLSGTDSLSYPFAHTTWDEHNYYEITSNGLVYDPPWRSSPRHLQPGPDSNNLYFNDGAPNQRYVDAVSPIAPARTELSFEDNTQGLIYWFDAGAGGKVVYGSFGLEGLNRHYYTFENVAYGRNVRGKLMHNIICWLRTGTIVGTVRDVEGGAPIEGALVRAIFRGGNERTTGPQVGTAFTRRDGSFNIGGLDPSVYEVVASAPGYTAQKVTLAGFHGGDYGSTSFLLTKAQPGILKGKVTYPDGTTPIQGALVTAKDVLNGQEFTALSDAQGNYVIPRLPTSDYDVTATKAGFSPDQPPQPVRVSIPPATEVTQDFRLKPAPGNVTGTVTRADTGDPIAGARVAVRQGTREIASAITDQNGQYTITGVDGGTYQATASAAGFSSQTKTIVVQSNQTITENFQLEPVPPGSISGLVIRQGDQQPEAGVEVEVVSSNKTYRTTTGPAQTEGGYTFNWRITGVDAGEYTVRVRKSGFTPVPESRTVTVESATEKTGVNFTLKPLHTFSAGLSLISVPFDYPTQDPADVLNVPAVDRPNFKLFAWSLGRYAVYPNVPADRVRLGRAFFLNTPRPLVITQEGASANTGIPFEIPLAPGWNMVGVPYNFSLRWLDMKVRDGANVVSVQEAIATQAIRSGLWTYISGQYVLANELQPWMGYWVRANRAVTLLIDPAGRSRSALTRSADPVQVDGWLVQIAATAGSATDASNYFGVSSRASDGYDALFDVERPPVVDGQPMVQVAFEHPEWGATAGQYAVDVRSRAAGQVWRFTVTTNLASTDVTLRFPNVARVPRGINLYLVDEATGQRRSLRTLAAYTFRSGEGVTTRAFRIEASNEQRASLRISNVSVLSRGNSRTISFTLNAEAVVSVVVLRNGQPVRELATQSTRSSGINTVTWDGRDRNGVSLPAGAYTVEIRATSADGQVARTVAPVVLTR